MCHRRERFHADELPVVLPADAVQSVDKTWQVGKHYSVLEESSYLFVDCVTKVIDPAAIEIIKDYHRYPPPLKTLNLLP